MISVKELMSQVEDRDEHIKTLLARVEKLSDELKKRDAIITKLQGDTPELSLVSISTLTVVPNVLQHV